MIATTPSGSPQGRWRRPPYHSSPLTPLRPVPGGRNWRRSAASSCSVEMNVDETDRHPHLLTQRELMWRAVDAGLPVLGIKRVRLTDEGEPDVLLGAFTTGDRVFQWHEDTFDLPDGADLLVAGDDVPNQAFRLGRTAWGVQFHFEVDAQGVEALAASLGAHPQQSPETDGGRDPRRVAIVPRRAAAAVAGAACGFRRPGALRDPLGGLVGGEAGRVGTVHSARTNSRDDVRPVDGDVDGAVRDGALLRQSCFEDSIAKKRREL